MKSKHCIPLLLPLALTVATLRAQDAALLFSTSSAGTTNAIVTWGLDAFAGNTSVITSGQIYMGSNEIGALELPFSMHDALTNGQLSPYVQSELAGEMAVAQLAGTNALWMFNSGTGDGVNSWYITGSNEIDTNKWAQCIIAHQIYCNHVIQWVSPFNEPDYTPWNQGSQSQLYSVMALLLASTNFSSSSVAGGTTLDVDDAVSWYDSVKALASVGTTHTLAGSYSSYLNWLSDVNSTGGYALNPEVHNLCEVIAGANYNLKGAIWWLNCNLTRGLFVNTSSKGTRLAYAEVPDNWSTAAVYRPTNNSYTAFGFMGSNERQGLPTTYQFTCLDRDVWFNGSGPVRNYTNTIGTDGENFVTISWGPDIPPPINGLYAIANRNSGKVMEVADASLENLAPVDINTYDAGSNQMWTITPIGGGYYTFVNANSGQYADMLNFSTSPGGTVDQYPGGGNFAEQWYFQYLSNGWFNIRQANSGLYLEVPGNTTNSGVQLDQMFSTGSLNQQWRLVPVGNFPFDLTAPAAPTGLSASPAQVSVTLNWTPNTESDLAGYIIFRATNSGGPYDTIAQAVTGTTFIDKSANQPRPYYYVIKAMNDSLIQSGYSAQASAAPVGGAALVANYPFDGNALDISGNGNNGVVAGTATYVGGKVGSAINLDGVTNYVSLPAGVLDFTNFTIAAWVNWNGGAAWQRIFDFGNGTGQYMFLTPGSGSGTFRFAVTTNGSGAEEQLNASPLPTNQWVHVAVTCNGSVGNLYTNGILAASNSGMNLSSANFNPALNYLGKSQYAADPLFGGKLEQVLVTDYALNSAQVALLVTNHAPRFTNSAVFCGNAIAGQPYAATIAGSAIDTDTGDSLTYREISGPAWLWVASNGTISGTPGPASLGTNYFLVSVFDIGGLASSATLSIYVGNPVPTTPTNLVWTVASGTNLNLSWPPGYIGWTLQSNSVGLAATGSWFAVSESSSTNQISLPINSSASNVFYRLVYP